MGEKIGAVGAAVTIFTEGLVLAPLDSVFC